MGIFNGLFQGNNQASLAQKKRNVQKHLRIANAIAAKFPDDPEHMREYQAHIDEAQRLIKRYNFRPLEPVSSKEYALKYR